MERLDARKRPLRLFAASLVVVTLLVVAVFWGSGAVRTWAAGVLAAVVGGWLTFEVQSWVTSRRDDRRAQNPPLVVTVESECNAFVEAPSASGEPVYVPAGSQCLRLYVEAADTRTAILTGLHVVVVSAEKAPADAEVILTMGTLDPRPFEVRLDEPRPRVRPLSEADFPFSVSPGDPEVIDVVAYTDTRDVRWRLVLAWTCEGRRGNTTVDFNGRPIRTIALPQRRG